MSKEQDLIDREVLCHYPWDGMEEAKRKCENDINPQVRPLIKTEYQYGEGNEAGLEGVVTKEIPYSANELAKLPEKYSRSAKETETEYVWRFSLTGGDDRIKLSEEEAQGY